MENSQDSRISEATHVIMRNLKFLSSEERLQVEKEVEKYGPVLVALKLQMRWKDIKTALRYKKMWVK